MRSIIAVCSVLAILTQGRLWAEEWRLEMEGSWCVAHLEDEFYDLEATTAVGFCAGASLSCGRAYSRVEYTLSWFYPPEDGPDLQVDRGDAFILLGCRVLNEPQILPYFGFRHLSTGASPGGRLVGGGGFTDDSRHQGYGMGLRVENTFREGRIAGFIDGFLLPWGSWECDRHHLVVIPGEVPKPHEHWEDDSPGCYGGSLGASYDLPQSKALFVAGLRFMVTRHTSDDPDSGVTRRFEQRWYGLLLGLRFHL